MRLIDADVLKEVIANNVYLVSDCINSRDYGMFWTGGIEKAIDEQPTIEELKKGKWLPDNNNYYEERFVCSECKGNFKVATCMGKPMWKFCPNCGSYNGGGDAE